MRIIIVFALHNVKIFQQLIGWVTDLLARPACPRIHHFRTKYVL